ncbi:MAG: hypothetical protein AAFU80_13945 [Pseudomonadota bacterium]
MTWRLFSGRRMGWLIGALAIQVQAVHANPGPIAQILCAPSAEMRDKLRGQFGADRIWQGLRSPDEVVELWEDERGDWTLVIAYANGNVCIVAMGSYLSGSMDMGRG